MVVCDYLGNIHLCTVTTMDNTETPLHTEINAILFGFETAHNFSYMDLMVESDSLMAIQKILKRQGPFCEWESIILDIVDLSLECRFCSFCHIRIFANVIAHNLAKLQCALGDYKV